MQSKMSWVSEGPVYVAAGVCVALTCLISFWHVYGQLRNYHQPGLQKHVIRIILMIPVYAVTSFLSISIESLQVAYYFQSIREVYEAYVIYNFVELLLAYMGGADELVSRSLADKRRTRTTWGMIQGWCCVSRPQTKPVDDDYYRGCMQAVLQFVILRVVYTVLEVVLDLCGLYGSGPLGSDTLYLTETVIFNVSVSLAIWALALFVFAAEPYLIGFRPIPKFLLVKGIIFVSFWQGAAVTLMLRFTGSAEGDSQSQKLALRTSSQALQDLLICFEALPAAFGNRLGFPPSDYRDEDAPYTTPTDGLGHVIDHSDFQEATEDGFGAECRQAIQAGKAVAPKPLRKWLSRKGWGKGPLPRGMREDGLAPPEEKNGEPEPDDDDDKAGGGGGGGGGGGEPNGDSSLQPDLGKQRKARSGPMGLSEPLMRDMP